MGMLGNQLAAGQALTVASDSFNGDGSTTAFTLSQTVSATTDIEVLVDNVQQSPYDGSYSVSGTTLTFSGTPSAGTNNIYVIYNASKHITTQQVIPDDGSVTHSKLHTNLDLSTKNVNPITMSTGTNKMQLAIQSNVSNRFALRSTHTADYDNNPFIIYQPSSAGIQNDALVINSNGVVTQPKKPVFMASQTTTLQNGGVAVNYGEDFDVGNNYDPSNGRFTAPVTGVYQFSCYIQAHATTHQTYTSILFRKNGSTYGPGELVQTWAGGADHTTTGGTITMQMTAGDYADVYAQRGFRGIQGCFTGHLIG